MSEIDQMVVRMASEIGRLREELDEVTLRNTRAANIRLAVIGECVLAVEASNYGCDSCPQLIVRDLRALADTKEGA